MYRVSRDSQPHPRVTRSSIFSSQVTCFVGNPKLPRFSVLRLPYCGLSFETIIKLLQSEAVVLKECETAKGMFTRQGGVNQSMLVALPMIADTPGVIA